jgi:hypothetical protein
MSRPNALSYKTLNWPAYNKALKRRGSLTVWFDPEMTWAAKPTGKRGRQPVYSDAAIQTCLTMKVLFGMALRQTTGFVESLLHLIGLDWAVPDFSTLSRRQKTLAVIIPFRGSQGPLHLLIDSITADGAYDTRKCHDAIAERGAAAVIPPRKNAKPWKADSAGAFARNEALRVSKYLGRTLWRRWSGYHRRSRVETKMHCVKLPGQRLMARDFDRQVAEFQVRVAVLNGFTALGIPVTKVVG